MGWRTKLANNVIIIGLCLNLVASFLMAYGRIFRSRETIKNESKTKGGHNPYEETHRLKETRIAQIGAIIMVIGFAIQIAGNAFFQ